MSSQKKNGELKRYIRIALIALACVIAFLSVFGENFGFRWSKIFKITGLSSEIADGEDFVKFLDVGQGDSILIYSNGQTALIDTGTEESALDICRELNKLDIDKIDVLLETHLHMDHIGGIEKVVSRFEIGNLILPDLTSDSEGYPAANAAKKSVLKTEGAVYTATPGMYINIGDFEITVLAYYADKSEENDRSIVCMAKIGEIKFLFPGDAQESTEKEMIKDDIDFDCDVLKVGHHGSKTSSCDEFISVATPEYAVISVGSNNQYSHPNKDIVEALKDSGAEIYRTNNQGSITFHIDEGEINVDTEYYD